MAGFLISSVLVRRPWRRNAAWCACDAERAVSTVGVVFVYLYRPGTDSRCQGPLVVVLFLTNTLMFVFLSGGVNYD